MQTKVRPHWLFPASGTTQANHDRGPTARHCVLPRAKDEGRTPAEPQPSVRHNTQLPGLTSNGLAPPCQDSQRYPSLHFGRGHTENLLASCEARQLGVVQQFGSIRISSWRFTIQKSVASIAPGPDISGSNAMPSDRRLPLICSWLRPTGMLQSMMVVFFWASHSARARCSLLPAATLPASGIEDQRPGTQHTGAFSAGPSDCVRRQLPTFSVPQKSKNVCFTKAMVDRRTGVREG